MKKLFIFLIIISAGIGVYYYQQTSICRQPLSYKIDGFDNNFGISRDKFLTVIKEAETIWEKGVGKNLFEYKPDGKLKISLVFEWQKVKNQRRKHLKRQSSMKFLKQQKLV